MKESKNFLGIYAIVIIVLLIVIMFLLPDSFFSRKYDANYEKYFGETTTSKKEEVENPKTGVEDYLIILAFILPFAGLTLYYLKDRGLFKGL